MADITLYGFPQSSYTWTARLALAEKDVAYEMESVELGGAGNLAVHPFGKIPALRHGDLVLYETSAICRYIDDAFDGPALAPGEATARAWMEQWISAANAYYDTDIIRHVVIERLVAPRRGQEPDEAKIAAALPRIEREMEILDAWLADHAFLAGDRVSIAEFFMLPIMFYLYLMPEGKGMCEASASVMRWWGAVSDRPSFAATRPPMPESDS